MEETAQLQVPKELQAILQLYENVMQPPEGLHPHRPLDHKIVLKEGTRLVNVQPYRYPQTQKDEIERLVKEMLTAEWKLFNQVIVLFLV